MFNELHKYKKNGHFFFSKGDNLKEVSSDVPNLPGVYYILKLANGKIDLVYIGKSGTIKNTGSFKQQGLQKRINNTFDNVKRQAFFEEKIINENIDALDIYWFVTFDEKNKDLPSFIEGMLLQNYFNIYNKLPNWNKEY